METIQATQTFSSNKSKQRTKFLHTVINSFIQLQTPPEHYSYYKIAQMLGVPDEVIQTHVLSEMVLAIEQVQRDPKVMGCSVDSIRRVLEIREVARSWKIEDDVVDTAFNTKGKALLKSAFS